MPVPVFAMMVFAICTWMGAGVVEAVMTDFAAEADVQAWVFVSVPGFFAMLFAFLVYRHGGAKQVAGMEQSLSRALVVAVLTWIAIALLISILWCPGYRALSCTSNVLLATAAIGGGPLLLAALVAGAIVGLALRRRPSWLAGNASRLQ